MHGVPGAVADPLHPGDEEVARTRELGPVEPGSIEDVPDPREELGLVLDEGLGVERDPAGRRADGERSTVGFDRAAERLRVEISCAATRPLREERGATGLVGRIGEDPAGEAHVHADERDPRVGEQEEPRPRRQHDGIDGGEPRAVSLRRRLRIGAREVHVRREDAEGHEGQPGGEAERAHPPAAPPLASESATRRVTTSVPTVRFRRTRYLRATRRTSIFVTASRARSRAGRFRHPP